MRCFVRSLLAIPLFAVALTAFITAPAIAAIPTTQPTSTVRGQVTSEGDVPLSEMVVYLESPDPARALPPATQPAIISQKDAQFEPKLTVISVGQSVDFLNDENRPIEHNVFSDSVAKQFDLGLFGPGSKKSVVFDKPGAVFLYCSIHRYMDGVIFVSPTPFTSRVDPQGHYEITGVSPGDWILRTWQRRRRFPEKTVSITVDASRPTEANLELKRK